MLHIFRLKRIEVTTYVNVLYFLHAVRIHVSSFVLVRRDSAPCFDRNPVINILNESNIYNIFVSIFT
jgi:hypothetical protein